MKRIYYIAVILFLFISNIYCVTNEYLYNYYHRNKDGTFLFENINDKEIKISLFKYKVEMLDGVVTKVVGYYYNTDNIKFLDIISNNKIISCEYYGFKTGLCIYKQIYTYKGDELVLIQTNGTDIGFNSYESAVLLTKENIGSNLYCSNRVIKNKSTTITIQSVGRFSESLQPIDIKTEYAKSDNNATAEYPIYEVFGYDEKKRLVEYNVFVTEKKILTYKKLIVYMDNIVNLITEEWYNEKGQVSIGKKKEKSNNLYFEYMTDDTMEYKLYKVTQTQSIRDGLEIVYYYDNSSVSNNTFSLKCDDENILFDNSHEVRVKNKSLSLYLDRFSESPYGPVNYIGIYK